MNRSTAEALVVRLYRQCLWLFPPAVRVEDGDEMVAAFAALWDEACTTRRRTFLIVRAFGRLPTAAAADWLERARDAAKGLPMDVRYARRAVQSRKGASVTVVATVAVAIGATTAVFSVVQGVLLSPLPYADSDRLVRVWQTKNDWIDSPNAQLRSFSLRFPLSMPTFQDWQAADLGFSDLGAYTGGRFVHQSPSGAELIPGGRMTSGVGDALGVQPILGRGLLPEDDEVGAPRVMIASHAFWRDRLGSRQEAIGGSFILDGDAHTIIGVMPPDFRWLLDGALLWTSFTDETKTGDRDEQFLNIVARIGPEASLESVRERLAIEQRRLEAVYPEAHDNVGSRVVPLLEAVVGDVRTTLWFLLGAVGLVLLVACANIANILSVVGLTRQREMAVKAAMGASPTHLLRGLFVETALLAGVGGMLGIALAWTSLPILLRMVPPSVPRHDGVGIDPSVLLFGVGLTAVTGVLVGILPAIQAKRAQPSDMLRASQRGATGHRTGARLRAGLVVTEVAGAFVLLVGAGLLGISFQQLWSVDRGFTSEHLVVLRAEPDPIAYPEHPDRDRFVADLWSELEAIPGAAASATNQVPLSGTMSSSTYQVEQPTGEPTELNVVLSVVLENYHDVMEIPLLAGRGFTAADDDQSPRVAIASRALASELWPGEDPIGKRVRSRGDSIWTTVVGVSQDVRHSGLHLSAEPKLYVPVWQNTRNPGQWVLRASGDVEGVVALARAAVARVSASTPVRSVELVEQTITEAVAVPRFRTWFVISLAGMAGVLALLGVYGVVTFAVQQRLPEIGVRMALGAQTSRVMRMVVGSGLKLATMGVVLGCVAALLLADTVSGFLYEIESTSPLPYVGVATAVVAVSCIAAYLPARRAARLDLTRVLNSEQ